MRDLRDFYSPHFKATINGTEFEVKCPSAREGVRLQLAMSVPEEAGKLNEVEEINKLFGSKLDKDGLPTGGLWSELNKAGVTYAEGMHLGTAALMYFGLGEEVAVWFWENGGIAANEDNTPKGQEPTAPKSS